MMEGKVVMITGAASGFGAETAVLLASKGCLLALVDKTPMEKTLNRCLDAGLTPKNILIIPADLTVLEELKQVPLKAVNYFEKLDVLINSAGITYRNNILESQEEPFNKVMDINCKAVLFLTQQAMPHLIKTRGNVVNVSSIYGSRPRPDATAYCISKAAVNQITECAALEFAPQQVRVNAVNPGHARTGLASAAGISEEEQDDQYEKIAKLYPLGRIAKPLEIAKAIAFLADDSQASFITGTCLIVDGGFHLKN